MTIFRSRPMSWPKHYSPPANPRLVYATWVPRNRGAK